MSFILHEYLEDFKLGKQLGLFDSWEEVEEAATEWHEVPEGQESCYLHDYDWGVAALDESTGLIWWFGSDCEQMDEWYGDVEAGKVPVGTHCYHDKWDIEQKAIKDATEAIANREWCLQCPEWGDWYLVPVDKADEFSNWAEDWDGCGDMFPEAISIDICNLTFKQPKNKNKEI